MPFFDIGAHLPEHGRMNRLWAVLALLLVGYAALVGLIWVFQRRLLYFPMGSLPPVARLLPGAQEVEFATEDGLTLGAWLVPPSTEPNGAAVLIFNGNGGNRSMRAPIAAAFAAQGYTALLFDYRGYGGNPGRPTEQGLIADGIAARRYLDSRPEVDPQRVVYYGESLGAAVSIDVAVQRPPVALILRSPFVSMVDLAGLHYPLLPTGWLLRDRYLSAEQVARIDCPLLAIAGEADRIVPYGQSRALFDAARMQVKRFVSVPRADHNDHELIGPEVMRQTMMFLRKETGVLQPKIMTTGTGEER